MKLTNIEMSAYLNSLKEISGKTKGKLSYAVARNIRKLTNELVEFEDTRNELICKYGSETENGQYIIDPQSNPDGFEKYWKDMQEYSYISHDVDIFRIDPVVFETSDLTAEDIMNIEFMIDEE